MVTPCQEGGGTYLGKRLVTAEPDMDPVPEGRALRDGLVTGSRTGHVHWGRVAAFLDVHVLVYTIVHFELRGGELELVLELELRVRTLEIE